MREANSHRITVKGGKFLEAVSEAHTIVFDKTGTLTKGEFKVTEMKPAGGVSEDKLLEVAALGESYSNHPIAGSIIEAYGKEIERSRVSDAVEIAGHGVQILVDGVMTYVGNEKLMKKQSIAYEPCESAGTVVYVGQEQTFLGALVISDTVKQGAAEAIHKMKNVGVKKCVMLTGDREKTAKHVADELKLDEVHAELLPGDKVDEVEKLLSAQKDGERLAFVGDGINDAPVLSRADVGIAMGAMGSDAAIEAADIVLMDDDPLKISVAKRIAKKTLRIVHQNIVFSIGVKVIVLVLGAIGLASMWAAIFADVGVMIIAVLNAMRALFAGGRAPVIPAAKNEGKTAAESLDDDKAAGAVSSPQETSAVHSYKIDVDCANCANLMEGAAKKTAGVRNAVVNFMMQEMKVEFRDGADPQQVMQQVRTNCKKVEDDCEIYL